MIFYPICYSHQHEREEKALFDLVQARTCRADVVIVSCGWKQTLGNKKKSFISLSRSNVVHSDMHCMSDCNRHVFEAEAEKRRGGA